MTTTDRRTIVSGLPGPGGYRPLSAGPGEDRIDRHELVDGTPSTAVTTLLICIAHLADLHVCDAQSPGRAEFLDRYADPDQPPDARVEAAGTYRPHELMTTQGAAAMVEALNEVTHGPVTGCPVDIAVVTGDVTDGGQRNELSWYLALLDGGTVHPDSGDRDRYEGVADDEVWDERFWHPESEKDDLPRSAYGFPVVPGFLDAVRRPFDSPGLDLPWLAVNGNHDGLVQGTITRSAATEAWLVGAQKPVGLPEGWTATQALKLLAGLDAARPEAVDQITEVLMRPVTPDPERRPATLREFVVAHLRDDARPPGHGFTAADADANRAYYRHDHGVVTFPTLDTVNPHGYWEGSVDGVQVSWLDLELERADAEQRYVVLLSHHPLARLTNGRSDGSDTRVLADAVAALIDAHPCVVLWLDGHTHTNQITPHGAGDRAWWEITAPSVVDYPQQARIVELARTDDGLLRIDVTNVDHAGAVPWGGCVDSVAGLAALSREISANDWQTRRHDLDALPRAGTPTDRNVTLWLTDPHA